jgi:hypothetical protein
VHQIVGGYLAKRIGDELLAPPRPERTRATDAGPVAEDGPPDEVEITDDRGRLLGTALRLPGVAVYVVSDGHSYRQDELEWCLAEPSGRRFVLREGGRIAGLVYAPPDRRRRRQRVEALRAEDV